MHRTRWVLSMHVALRQGLWATGLRLAAAQGCIHEKADFTQGRNKVFAESMSSPSPASWPSPSNNQPHPALPCTRPSSLIMLHCLCVPLLLQSTPPPVAAPRTAWACAATGTATPSTPSTPPEGRRAPPATWCVLCFSSLGVNYVACVWQRLKASRVGQHGGE